MTRGVLTIDVTIAAPTWTRALRTAAAVCKRAALTAFALAPKRRKPAGAVELAIVLTSDSAIRKLNAAYRGKDKATDVLSFPAWSKDESHGQEPGSIMLGDVIVAYAASARDAKTENKPLATHLSHLVVHGVLHLLGYDHEDDREAAIMERLEIAVLKTLRIANPYIARPARKTARKPGRPAS